MNIITVNLDDLVGDTSPQNYNPGFAKITVAGAPTLIDFEQNNGSKIFYISAHNCRYQQRVLSVLNSNGLTSAVSDESAAEDAFRLRLAQPFKGPPALGLTGHDWKVGTLAVIMAEASDRYLRYSRNFGKPDPDFKFYYIDKSSEARSLIETSLPEVRCFETIFDLKTALRLLTMQHYLFTDSNGEVYLSEDDEVQLSPDQREFNDTLRKLRLTIIKRLLAIEIVEEEAARREALSYSAVLRNPYLYSC